MWDLRPLTRARTHAPALETQSLNHWTAREVPEPLLNPHLGPATNLFQGGIVFYGECLCWVRSQGHILPGARNTQGPQDSCSGLDRNPAEGLSLAKQQKRLSLKKTPRTSLVARWLRIHLPMQGTQVQALVREDTTCHGTAKPMSHNH